MNVKNAQNRGSRLSGARTSLEEIKRKEDNIFEQAVDHEEVKSP